MEKIIEERLCEGRLVAKHGGVRRDLLVVKG
jgi:hypothetical protein